MKKIIYFILLGAIFHVISCTRSAVDGGSAKVVFQVPTFESSHLQSAKVDNFVNNLMTTPGLRVRRLPACRRGWMGRLLSIVLPSWFLGLVKACNVIGV